MSNHQGAVPSITACPDGPLLVRGDIELFTGSGEKIIRNRKTVALCRCGASTMKPYCDGTHKLIKFITDNRQEPDSKLPQESSNGSGPAGRKENVET